MVGTLMRSAKLPTAGFLKIKAYWCKGYGTIISVQDSTKRILSGDSNYVVNVVMWPTFGNSIAPLSPSSMGLKQSEARRQEFTNFFFKMFKIMRFLRSSKRSIAIVELWTWYLRVASQVAERLRLRILGN